MSEPTRVSTPADTSPPYASGASRLRLIYQLPLTGRERTVLVLASQGCMSTVLGIFPGDVDATSMLPGTTLAASTYDAILLPGVGSSPDAEEPGPSFAQVLRTAAAALKPGGVLVGHIEHRSCLKHVVRGVSFARHVRTLALPWTGAGCRRALLDAGLDDARCFYVEPAIEDPMALIPVEPAIAQAHFDRAIRRTRGQYRLPGYLMRLGLARLHLGGLLQPHLFFWACRPC